MPWGWAWPGPTHCPACSAFLSSCSLHPATSAFGSSNLSFLPPCPPPCCSLHWNAPIPSHCPPNPTSPSDPTQTLLPQKASVTPLKQVFMSLMYIFISFSFNVLTHLHCLVASGFTWSLPVPPTPKTEISVHTGAKSVLCPDPCPILIRVLAHSRFSVSIVWMNGGLLTELLPYLRNHWLFSFQVA